MSVSADAPQSAEDSSSPDTDDNISDPTTGLTDQTDTEADSTTPDTVASIPSSGLTQVDFFVTVPAYQSDALRVDLSWGDTEIVGI